MQQKATDKGLPWSEHDLVFRNAHSSMVTAYNLGKWVDKVYSPCEVLNVDGCSLIFAYFFSRISDRLPMVQGRGGP